MLTKHEVAYHWSGFRHPRTCSADLVKKAIPRAGENLPACALMWLAVSVPWKRIEMGQTTRILKRANALPDLLKMLRELEELRERVRVAEASRVLH